VTAVVIIATYLAIGGASAVLALRREAGAHAPARLRSAAAGLLLWPFTLPFALGSRSAAGGPTAPSRANAETIGSRAQRLDEALVRARGAVPGVDLDRVGRMAARLGRRLRRLDGRLGELDRAIDEATASVRGPLEALRADSQRELEGGLRLMDELTGKLTLLAFADLGAGGSELDEIRTLLNRLEAMACATREVAAVST